MKMTIVKYISIGNIPDQLAYYYIKMAIVKYISIENIPRAGPSTFGALGKLPPSLHLFLLKHTNRNSLVSLQC